MKPLILSPKRMWHSNSNQRNKPNKYWKWKWQSYVVCRAKIMCVNFSAVERTNCTTTWWWPCKGRTSRSFVVVKRDNTSPCPHRCESVYRFFRRSNTFIRSAFSIGMSNHRTSPWVAPQWIVGKCSCSTSVWLGSTPMPKAVYERRDRRQAFVELLGMPRWMRIKTRSVDRLSSVCRRTWSECNRKWVGMMISGVYSTCSLNSSLVNCHGDALKTRNKSVRWKINTNMDIFSKAFHQNSR